MSPLPAEIQALAASVVLLVVQVLIQGQLATRDRGLAWNAGPRDGAGQPLGTAAKRAERALRNLLETYPAFVALALALVVAGRSGGIGAAGAWLWLAARVVYAPLYLFGVPWLRSLAFAVSLAALAMMLVRLF